MMNFSQENVSYAEASSYLRSKLVKGAEWQCLVVIRNYLLQSNLKLTVNDCRRSCYTNHNSALISAM